MSSTGEKMQTSINEIINDVIEIMLLNEIYLPIIIIPKNIIKLIKKHPQ